MTARSILANASDQVRIHHVYPKVETGCTGFSAVRYNVRKGIYLDCDMIVLGDICELMQYHQPGMYSCLQDGSTEVGVIDIPPSMVGRVGSKRDERLLPLQPIIPPVWNSEDCVMPGAKLVHFTDLNTQPWFTAHPNKEARELYENYRTP